MNIRNLIQDEDAVSPVIGVILMVAITVILAAVIGTFVLGLGGSTNSAPQASFTFDFDSSVDPADTSGLANGLADSSDNSGDGNLTVTHDGGDSIEAARLTFTDGDESYDADSGALYGSNTLTAGSSASFAIDNSDTVRVTWASESGDSTATLAEFSAPDA